MSKEIILISVGKLKDKNLITLEKTYLRRLTSMRLTIHEVKSNTSNRDAETKNLQKKIHDLTKDKKGHIIFLDEKGKSYTSHQFSKWIFKLIEKAQTKIIFIIGGAEGHSKEILEMGQDIISLSSLTFPHRLARLFFIEQLYRAQTLQTNHPYHN